MQLFNNNLQITHIRLNNRPKSYILLLDLT